MVDCRSLIEFCKAFEQHKNMANSANSSSRSSQRPNSRTSTKKQYLTNPFCEHSPFAAFDVLLLLVVLGSLGFLAAPYFIFVATKLSQAIPQILELFSEVIQEAPLAYVIGLVVAFVIVISGIAIWEFLEMQSRKCGKANCKGLRKAVEFDIQLESEECVKFLPQVPTKSYGVKPLELGEDHKELEAELKKMAPVNGRTVLIFRSPCGCPAGRLEVWGSKKVRKIKK